MSELISANSCFCCARTVHWNSQRANTCNHR